MNSKKKTIPKKISYTIEKKQIDQLFQLYDNGKIKECEAYCRRMLEKYPLLLPAMNVLGGCLNGQRKYEEAIQIFTRINKVEPTFIAAHYNRGIACQHMGLFEEAIKCFDRAIELNPEHIDAVYTKGIALSELKRHKEAIPYLELTINSQKNNINALQALGNAYENMQKYDEAMALYIKASKINNKFADAVSSQARLHGILGNKSQAIDLYKKALEIKPESYNTHRALSRLITYEENDPNIPIMEKGYSRGIKNEKKRMHLCYALSKAYEDIGKYDKSFYRLKEANDLRKKEIKYTVFNDIKLIESIMKVFRKSRLTINANLDVNDEIKPYFILGMPRSGTSLVEQILSSHPKVFGAGELDEVRRFVHEMIFSKNMARVFTPLESQKFHRQYLDKLRSLNVAEQIIIDKMPHNFLYIGYILMAFPNAKIINLNRDPVAVCWSIYQRFFPAIGIGFAYDLEDLSTFYTLYKNMMKFWKQQFPGKIYDLEYETLTENQEEETRKLLKFCDLEWKDDCLNFHQTKRQVRTASLSQVRNKMYTGSSKAWHKFEKHLQPLIKSLNYKTEVS